MLPYKDDTDYGWEWYREWLHEYPRIRFRRGRGWRATKALETVHQAFVRLGRWYGREGEFCLNLEPACEMPYG